MNNTFIPQKEQELEAEKAANKSSESFVANCRTFETQITKELVKKIN